MTKEEWEKQLSIVSNLYNDIYVQYEKYNNARNKQIKKASEKELEFYTLKVRNLLRGNQDLYNLFMEGFIDGNVAEVEKWGQLSRPDYLISDISELIRNIKLKIEQFK